MCCVYTVYTSEWNKKAIRKLNAQLCNWCIRMWPTTPTTSKIEKAKIIFTRQQPNTRAYVSLHIRYVWMHIHSVHMVNAHIYTVHTHVHHQYHLWVHVSVIRKNRGRQRNPVQDTLHQFLRQFSTLINMYTHANLIEAYQ